MLAQQFGALLLAASTAYGFKDTAPFFMLSTESLKQPALSSVQISTSSQLENKLLSSLSDCSAQLYLIVAQHDITADALRTEMPRVRERALDTQQYKSVVEIPEVLGNLSPPELVRKLEDQCGNSKSQPDVRLVFAPSNLPSSLADAYFESQITPLLANHSSHVLIWTSTAPSATPESPEYAMDEEEYHTALHTDFKRDDTEAVRYRRAANSSDYDPQAGLPLFERYQFLSPAIFMGLLVSLILFLILYVGIKAIAGLEVSYMAFSKEMGPAAQAGKPRPQQ